MAKYFSTAAQAPISFNKFRPTSPVSIGNPRSVGGPSDEEKKRQAERDAYQEAQVDVSPPPETDAAPGDSELTINYPKQKVNAIDPNRFKQGLEARGYSDVWQSLEKNAIEIDAKKNELDEKQLTDELKHTSLAVQAAYAGHQDLALNLVNKFQPDGKKITAIKPIDDNNVRVFSEDNPAGEVHKRDEIDRLAMDADHRAQRWGRQETKWINGSAVTTITDQKGDVKHISTVAAPKNDEKLTPYEIKAQQSAAEEASKVDANKQAVAEKAQHLTQAVEAFRQHLAAGHSTGGNYMVPGALRIGPQATTGQAVDRSFSALNLDEMTSKFKGMAQTVNSANEREYFEKAQPNVTNEPEVNATLLVGATKLATAQYAEDAAKRQYYSENHTVDKYVSPVIGKQQILFDKNGYARLIKNEDVDSALKSGYLTGDQMASRFLSSKGEEHPKVSLSKSVKGKWEVTKGANKGKTKIEYDDGSVEYQ